MRLADSFFFMSSLKRKARSSTLMKSSNSESLRSNFLDDNLVTGPTLSISRRRATKFFLFMSLFVVLLMVLTEEPEEMSTMEEDEEWRLKNGVDVDLMILDVLLRRPTTCMDGERAKRPEEPFVHISASLVALETTVSSSSSSSSSTTSLTHNSSFSPMDVSDKLDDRRLRVGRPVFLAPSSISDKLDDRRLLRRLRRVVGRLALVPSSISSVVPMEMKGGGLAGGLLGSYQYQYDSSSATILFDADCAMVSILSLSNLSVIA